jgi:tripartite-type tricarboxylate transporter receptor subunit TctC
MGLIFRKSLKTLAFLVSTILVTVPYAQDINSYPNKPIRLIVGFATGGISDVIARALSAKITEQIGQSVIVENKPGAGTTIAADFVAKSTPDGYTLFLQDMTSHAINSSLYKKLTLRHTQGFFTHNFGRINTTDASN